ncbi:hypothetical protein [Nitrosomonas sp.]|uniref:hypothetical protein n=1 Tax=Nitrosomonas sp. TaxID=42353 RepID=UPI00374C8CBC
MSALFFRLFFMAGRLWESSGGRYSWRFLTCFWPATSLRNEVADLNHLHEVIMTTPAKAATATSKARSRREPKTPTIYPLSRYEIERRLRARGLESYMNLLRHLQNQ